MTKTKIALIAALMMGTASAAMARGRLRSESRQPLSGLMPVPAVDGAAGGHPHRAGAVCIRGATSRFRTSGTVINGREHR